MGLCPANKEIADGRNASPAPASGRPPKFGVALIPLVAMALLLGVGYGVYKIKAQVLLVAAASLTAVLGLALGFKWKDMERGIVDSIHKAMPAILIMLSVGILVGSWMASGTIPMVIYYGLKLISPKFFLATACLVCSVVAVASGTSWGTIGTVGVAFIGIAMGLGIPLGPAAGAVVAGAYFGDKMSPLSDIPNLATVISGSNLFDHIKHMMWSAVPAWLAGLAIYFVVGLKYGATAVRSETLDLILTTLRANFRFNLLLLLPMAVIFYFAVAKKPTIPAMVLSSAVAAALAVLVQKIPFTDVATAMNAGLPARTGVELVDKLLAKGGMMSMMETQLIAFTAFAYGGIMQTHRLSRRHPGQGHEVHAARLEPGPDDDRRGRPLGHDHRQLLPVDDPARPTSWRPSIRRRTWRPRTCPGSSRRAAASSCRSSPGAWPASTSPGPWASRRSPTCPGPS